MTKIMMMLGPYPFMLNTAAYQQLKRISSYRWRQQDRIGRKPAQQFVGVDADQITLSGEILSHWKGGYGQLDLMRAQANLGKPLVLLEGHGGFVLGDWVILKIEETGTDLEANGAPRVIAFSITLKEYGGDEGGFDGFGLKRSDLNLKLGQDGTPRSPSVLCAHRQKQRPCFWRYALALTALSTLARLA